MPFCPKCRFEFFADVLMCPDCNVSLVDHLPTRPVLAVVPDDSWVVVGSSGTGAKTDIIKGSLDSNNIPSVSLSRQFQPPAFAAPAVPEQTLVMVPKEFQEEAQLIVEAVLGEDHGRPGQRR